MNLAQLTFFFQYFAADVKALVEYRFSCEIKGFRKELFAHWLLVLREGQLRRFVVWTI